MASSGSGNSSRPYRLNQSNGTKSIMFWGAYILIVQIDLASFNHPDLIKRQKIEQHSTLETGLNQSC